MDPILFPTPPSIRCRIGVTGHRAPPKLPDEAKPAIRAELDRIIGTVISTARQAEIDYKNFLSSPDIKSGLRPPPADLTSKFVVVSSMAEGADRMVADAGLAAGCTLEAVLPFGRDEYARDFETPDAKADYERLLGIATAVFELDGAPDDRPRAYEAAGLVMLSNIDLLITIWDGQEAAGVGGTAQIVSRAVGDSMPVVWVDPANPGAMKLSWPTTGKVPPANARAVDTFRAADLTDLAGAVGEIMALPKRAAARESLLRFLNEQEQRRNYCPWYSLLLWVYRVRPLSWGDFHLPAALADSVRDWQNYLSILPADRSLRPAILDTLLPAFAAPDHIAIYYAHIYRSSYVFNFMFAAFAVALALGGVFTHEPGIKSGLVTVELAVIISILVMWLNGNRKDWHKRWLEYRRLAECIRHLRIFAPLGSEGSVDRPRPGLDTDEEDWVNWYAWSLRRRLPLPDCKADAAYLKALCQAVRETEIEGQIKYHKRNAARMHTLDHRIHHSGQWLFGITACLCLLFVLSVWTGMLGDVEHEVRDLVLSVFTFITAFLPTLGAALSAIHVQGDFRTVAEQSARTHKRLSTIDDILANEDPMFARLADRIEKTSDVMMSDLMEWQTVFRTRPLSLPA